MVGNTFPAAGYSYPVKNAIAFLREAACQINVPKPKPLGRFFTISFPSFICFSYSTTMIGSWYKRAISPKFASLLSDTPFHFG